MMQLFYRSLAIAVVCCSSASMIGASESASDSTEGEAWLARSIAFHDPDGSWMQSKVHIIVDGSYADGRTNTRDCTIDYSNGDFAVAVVRDGLRSEQGFTGGKYWFHLEGEDGVSDELREQHQLTEERATLMRDYMGFLWGLPMKMGDEGAQVADRAPLTVFEGQRVRDVTITYDPAVGTDIWHVYLDPETARMVGYAFFHDAEESEGERIVLEGETLVGHVRVPTVRKWYRTQDGSYLGADTLREASVGSAED